MSLGAGASLARTWTDMGRAAVQRRQQRYRSARRVAPPAVLVDGTWGAGEATFLRMCAWPPHTSTPSGPSTNAHWRSVRLGGFCSDPGRRAGSVAVRRTPDQQPTTAAHPTSDRVQVRPAVATHLVRSQVGMSSVRNSDTSTSRASLPSQENTPSVSVSAVRGAANVRRRIARVVDDRP